MNTERSTQSTTDMVLVRRVITASAVRKINSDNARLKKTKKALHRMKKEKDE